MSNLRTLTFAAVPKQDSSPQQTRRNRLIERLEEQKRLVADPTYTRHVKCWKTENGERVLIEKRLTVRPWWKSDEKGQIVLTVRLGYKAIEFEKGKAGIMVGKAERLPEIIETLVNAVRGGELDNHLDTKQIARAVARLKS